ncbi:MAG: TetR/AcrR family transcriptional regulator [Mycobacteriaceae bacterium]|nr:TetR/AcrR family transcriptional regulator [Mycobacteriaceae bacterium]
MVRQARSEATRQKIIAAAVDLFSEVGYPATGLGDIIERAEMTKGALYYHFDSKESLATAIIEEAGATLLTAFQSIRESSSPALESIIHGVFVTANLLTTDKLARTGTQLLRAFGEFNEAAARTYGKWVQEMTATARQAQVEGDVHADIEAAAVGELVVGAMIGGELISSATPDATDLPTRMRRSWEILLRAIATAESHPYFREFLARESMRHVEPTLSFD